MSKLTSTSVFAAALVFGVIGCSDSSDPVTINNGGTNSGVGGASGASGAGGGTSGSGGSSAGSGGASGAANGGSAGSAGAAGGAGVSGAAGSAGSEGDAGFPVPDKLAALTFDDGPENTRTAAVLDKLEAHGVPASFFLIGQLVTANTQAVMQRALSLGCTLENHSFGYESMTTLTAEQITTSITNTINAIEQFTDDSPQFFRPPNLAINALMYTTIDFPFAGGVVGGDFPAEFGGNPTVEAVSNAVLNGVQDGSIILLHDVQNQNPHPTPDALDIIIPELRRRGFELVTIRELFQRRGVDPNSQQDVIWNIVPPTN